MINLLAQISNVMSEAFEKAGYEPYGRKQLDVTHAYWDRKAQKGRYSCCDQEHDPDKTGCEQSAFPAFRRKQCRRKHQQNTYIGNDHYTYVRGTDDTQDKKDPHIKERHKKHLAEYEKLMYNTNEGSPLSCAAVIWGWRLLFI